MKNLAGRTAVITGAGSGIGRATAIALAVEGVSTVIADIDEDSAAAVAEEINASGGRAAATFCDVAKEDAFERLRDFALGHFKKVDIVMNNVGLLVSGRPEDIPLAEWERILNTNLLSVVRSNHVFLPLLIGQGDGHIVNTASFAGLYAYAYDRLPYAASKAAIIAMSEGLALYLKPHGVGITCLCPGPVKTNIGKSLKTWGEPLGVRGPGPEFLLMEAEAVGDMVVTAILEDRFFLPTDPQVYEILRRRAADVDAFVEAQLRDLEERPYMILE